MSVRVVKFLSRFRDSSGDYFKIWPHIFMIFEGKLMILVTPKQEVEHKTEWFTFLP